MESKQDKINLLVGRSRNVINDLLRSQGRLKLSGSVEYKYSNQLLVPCRGGVYLIHDIRGALYVGRTNSLYRRFIEHYWHADNELLHAAIQSPVGNIWFSWRLEDQHINRVNLECELIAWLEPFCNKTLGG